MDITRIRTVLALRWLYGWRKTSNHKFSKRFQNSLYTFNDWRSAMNIQQASNESSAKLIEKSPLCGVADLDLRRFNTTTRVCLGAMLVASVCALGAGGLIAIAAGGLWVAFTLSIAAGLTFAAFLFQWTASWTLLHNVPTLNAEIKPGTHNSAMQLPQTKQPIKAGVYLQRGADGATWLQVISPSGLFATLFIKRRPANSVIQRAIDEVVEATK